MPWAKVSPWLFSAVIDSRKFGHTRDELIQELAKEGIESRPFFIPIHSLPAFRDVQVERIKARQTYLSNDN